jgi:hypothetical protein
MMLEDVPVAWHWYGGAAVLLFGAITICHLVTWNNRSKRFWQLVDYVWLAVASLGLLAGVDTILSAYKSRLISSAEMYVEKSRSDAELSAAIAAAHFRARAEIERVQTLREASSWFKTAGESLTDVDKNSDWERYLPNGIGIVKLPEDAKQDQSAFVKGIQELKTDVDVLHKIRGDAGPSSTEMITYILSPILLILALAIRITKVTATVRGNTE